MKREIVAFISLGFPCGGPEMGEYGKFSVELTEAENSKIEEIVSSDNSGNYHRVALADRYPEIHAKIVSAAGALQIKVLSNDALCYVAKPRCYDVDKILEKSKTYEEALATVNKKLGCELDLEMAEVCYYLSKDEIPSDYNE